MDNIYYNFYYYVTYWLHTKGYQEPVLYFTFDIQSNEVIWHSWTVPIDKPTIEELLQIPKSTILEFFPQARIS